MEEALVDHQGITKTEVADNRVAHDNINVMVVVSLGTAHLNAQTRN